MKLVKDAKQSWRWFSMQALVFAGALQTTWVSLPDDMKATVPDAWVSIITIGLLVFGAGGRLVDQSK